MNEEIAMMTCDWCGKEFPADANACVDAGIHAWHPPEEGEEWKGNEPTQLSPQDFSEEEREHMKATMGLTDAQLEELLRTGNVEGLGGIVCIECQDAGLDVEEHD